jgi:trans-2,3-dihydro-3-hydroxyanthranilate isomerase
MAQELVFTTLDVFSDHEFGGNPLAVYPHAEGLSTQRMQQIAREMNYSETTFVLPPKDPLNTAEVRIFTPVAELPFAGHPNVGTRVGFGAATRLGARPGVRWPYDLRAARGPGGC